TISGGASGNTIGGTATGAGNVISGNIGDGVKLAADSNVVIGNYIGTNAAGTAAVPNTTGIEINSSSNRVGTNADGVADAAERNVIAGSAHDGIIMSATGATVAGNYIGLDPTGASARPNQGFGIQIDSGGSNNRIGGGTTAARNVISAS